MSEEFEFEEFSPREAVLDAFTEDCPSLVPEHLEQVVNLLANPNAPTEELEECLSVLAQKMDEALVAYRKLDDAYDEVYGALTDVEYEIESLLSGEEGSL